MGFDVAGVHRDRSVHASRSGQGVKNARPNSLTAPAIEAVVDRRVGAIDFRAIAPARPGFQHVHDAANHATIIYPMRSFPRAAATARSASIPHRKANKPALPSKPPNRFGELESQMAGLLNPIEYRP